MEVIFMVDIGDGTLETLSWPWALSSDEIYDMRTKELAKGINGREMKLKMIVMDD